MKLTLAVLALLCLGTVVNASSQAADGLKLPLAGLFANQAADAFAQANITLSDLAPKVSLPDIAATLQSLPKFQFPSVNIQGGLSLGNSSNIMVPLVPLLGLKAKKVLPLVSVLGLLNQTKDLGATLNLTLPSLPKPSLNLNISSAVVPLHALLSLPKAVPLQPLLASLNATHSFQIPAISLPHPHMPSINISDVGVPLTFLLSQKVKGLPLLSFLGNVSASLPVFSVSKNISLPVISAMPFKALISLRGLPKVPSINVDGITNLAVSALSGLSINKTISLPSLSKSVNISDLTALLSQKANLLANLGSKLGNATAGPSVDVNVRPGSLGMKNVAFNLTHPTLGLKNLALALNIPAPELALKLANLNLSLPLPDVKLGSKAINVSVPLLDVQPQLSNVTLNVPMASVTLPTVSMDFNKSGDGNTTSFVKNFAFTKPGLSMGSANITLPILKPDLALKLAQLGINVPTPQLGLKRANIGAQVPLPSVNLGSKAVNLTLPVPDVAFKQIGVNLTVPDIQLPKVEVNVSGLPKLGLDALKSATLLSWLKDAGFYSLNKSVSIDGTTTIDLQRN